MSSSITDDRFVTNHIYERDMERINATLDKLIEYVQLSKQADAHAAGKEESEEKAATSRGQVRLIIIGASLTLVGSFIMNLLSFFIR